MRYMILFFLLACSKSTIYDEQTCNTLSRQAFRGSPKSAFKLKKFCKNIEIKYTKSHCQNALSEFILGKPLKHLEAKFGNKISECFSTYDIKKFAREDDRIKLKSMRQQ